MIPGKGKWDMSLPEAPEAIGNYAPGVITGNLLFLSGQTPPVTHPTNHANPLDEDADLLSAQNAAMHAALNALSQAKNILGSLDRVQSVVRVTGYVKAHNSFTQHATVINGASEAFQQILGSTEKHARSAIGVSSLPHGAIVELDVILEINNALK